MVKMKAILISFILLATVSCSEKSGKKTDKKASKMEFEETNHNFGEIKYGGEASFDFIFSNKGKSPLIIDNVRSTCGCTVPEWTREPVNESNTGSVRVIYDTHRVGAFSKTLIVYSNAANSPVRLFIKGRVLPSEENPADSVKKSMN
jgi:hypothetical protein